MAIHDFAYSRGLIDPALIPDTQKKEPPPVPQAVIRSNPMTGAKNFYAGAHASFIRDMPVDKGRAWLRELTEMATKPQYVYVHEWQQYDLVMWDNRCCACTEVGRGTRRNIAGSCTAPQWLGLARRRIELSWMAHWGRRPAPALKRFRAD